MNNIRLTKTVKTDVIFAGLPIGTMLTIDRSGDFYVYENNEAVDGAVSFVKISFPTEVIESYVENGSMSLVEDKDVEIGKKYNAVLEILKEIKELLTNE